MLKYELDKTAKKYKCPKCNQRTFVRFVDENNEYLEYNIGRCDREVNCGYFKKPVFKKVKKNKENKEKYITGVVDQMSGEEKKADSNIKKIELVEYVPKNEYRKLSSYKESSFYTDMQMYFDAKNIDTIFQLYGIKTINHLVAIPYVNKNRKITAVQIKGFKNMKTVSTNWFHTMVNDNWTKGYKLNEKKVRCLFGDHLLKDNNLPCIIVESPKSALICAINELEQQGKLTSNYLSVGALNWIQRDRLPLNRKLTLIPDCSTRDKAADIWERKTRLEVVRTFDQIATDEQKTKGYDIADFLLENLTYEKTKKMETTTISTRFEKPKRSEIAFVEDDEKKKIREMEEKKEKENYITSQINEFDFLTSSNEEIDF